MKVDSENFSFLYAKIITMENLKFEPEKVVVIAKGNTMEQALEFAKAMYWYKGKTLEQCTSRADARIGVMDKIDYFTRPLSFYRWAL